MGITGTEVVKKVADCILVDDSFSTIVDGVEEGRRITANIKKVILYLLAGNIVEVILVFASMLMNMEMFTTLQLLWINLVTDSIPAIMLAFEKCDKDVMENTPANRSSSSFFTPFLTAKIVIGAIVKSAVMLVIFMYYAKKDLPSEVTNSWRSPTSTPTAVSPTTGFSGTSNGTDRYGLPLRKNSVGSFGKKFRNISSALA